MKQNKKDSTKEDKKIDLANKPKVDQKTTEQNELKAKIAELENGWRRTQADFENFRNRTQKEKAELIKYSNEDLILNLLPAVDNFSRALNHEPKELENNEYVKGLLYIKIQLEQILGQYGLTKIETKVGDVFDHNIHEAIEQVTSDKLKSGQIAEIVLDGYRLGDKIVRVAKVKVVK